MPARALIAPFTAALARFDAKSPVAATLTSEEWAEVPTALRERAFFSARIARADTVATLQRGLRQALSLEGETFMDSGKFVATMREAIGAPEGDSGDLTDLASRRRLELIYKQNVESAREYGRWKSGQAPALRAAFPAQELLRVESREAEREWGQRWADAGGQFYGPQNRMIALKGDPVWAAISRFGTPWPPFDFGSGMGVEDVSRDEAEELGVIAPEAPAPIADEPAFNSTLEAGVQSLPADLAAALVESMGGKARLVGGVIRWLGGGGRGGASA